jgi:hypothetical protein
VVGPDRGPRADGTETCTLGPGQRTVLDPLMESRLLRASWILTSAGESSECRLLIGALDEPLLFISRVMMAYYRVMVV